MGLNMRIRRLRFGIGVLNVIQRKIIGDMRVFSLFFIMIGFYVDFFSNRYDMNQRVQKEIICFVIFKGNDYIINIQMQGRKVGYIKSIEV